MPSFSVCLHARDESHKAVDNASEVNTHDPVVIIETRLVGGSENADSRIVNQQMKGPAFGSQLAQRMAIGDIQFPKRGMGWPCSANQRSASAR